MENPWQNLMRFVDRVDSTMDSARALAQAGAPHGTTVVAREQTQGRGRRGRTWISPPGHGLTMTTLLRPSRNTGLHTLSLVAAVAVRRAAVALGAHDVALKWPNDLWVGERKLAGILLEADGLESAAPLVLVGVGVNVASTQGAQLSEDIRKQAVGLLDAGVFCAAGDAQALEQLRMRTAHHTAAALCATTAAWSERGLAAILEEWTAADALASHRVRAELEGSFIEGVACGLDAQGQLRIATQEGVRCVQSGVVERVRPQKSGPVATR